MALAKKCDRCGIFYKAYGHLSPETPNGFAYIIRNDETSFLPDYYVHELKDLCPSCMKELNQFMEAFLEEEKS